MQGGALEVPGQEGVEVFGGGFGLLADVFVVGEEALLDEPLYATPVEGAETARQVAEAQQGVAADVGVPVFCEVRTGALGPLAILRMQCHLDGELLKLERIVALERLLVAQLELFFPFGVHRRRG